MQNQMRLEKMAERCDFYFRKKVFPKWSQEAVLGQKGFLEEFIIDSREPHKESSRRVRVQGRQIWAFAKAYSLGYGEHLLPCSIEAWQCVKKEFKHKDGGFIHSVTVDGEPLNAHRYLYEQTFLLLGLSALYGATKDDEYIKEAHNLYGWINEELAAEEGFYTSAENKQEARQQNPHMHLFEALMALFEETKDSYWLKEAEKIHSLFCKYFFDNEHRLLREFFTGDWKSYDKEKGHSVEPGHNYEWVWLLHLYNRLSGTSSSEIQSLYDFGVKGTSLDGLGYDECFPDGKLIRATSRMWVQTEALKANITQYELYGDSLYLDRMEQIIDNLFAYYLFDDGLWGDQLDADKNELSKVTPATTLYHLFLAFIEVVRVSQKP